MDSIDFDVEPSNLPVPPQALAAEASVIGGCLIEASAYDRVRSIVSTDDFYDRRHKIVFNAIGQLVAVGSAVDVLLVDEYLKDKGLSESVGGLAWLGGLAVNTPMAANVAEYAKRVREKSICRTVIATAQAMMTSAQAGQDVQSIISTAESQIFALGQQGLRGKRGFAPIREPLGAVLDEMESLIDKPPRSGVVGQSSGLADLDRLTNGFSAGDLIIVAARPSMGKTTWAMNVAEHIAMNDGKPVAVFSMEMSKQALAKRSLSSVSGLSLSRANQPWTLQDSDWALVSAGLSRLANSPIFIDDTAALTISELRSRLMRLVTELGAEFPQGLGAVVIDYIQLMGVDNGGENRNAQIEVISRGLKQIAKELGVPVFALSQLNRNTDSRPNKRPVMSDLRDSGSLEQDADLILFLYRDEVYNKDSADKGIAELIIGKQRNGPVGTVRMLFDGECVRFRGLAAGWRESEDYE